jgi:creatinine amidohydrolase
MLTPDTPDRYQSLPRLTSGDEAFRKKFLSWDLGNLTYVDIREYLAEKDTVLIPMASLEQHGPHLPLDTDTITAVEMAARGRTAPGTRRLSG